MKWANVRLNDKVLVTTYGGYSRNRGYYNGTVTKVTKTRFTVVYNGTYEQSYNKDGSEYPRRTGYGNGAPDVSPLNEDGLMLIRKHRMANKAQRLAGKLDDIFSNGNYRNKISSMDLSIEEIEENISLLEQVYERFKKFGPMEEV